MKKAEVRHSIVVHGLKSHHGTLRARLCLKYLRKYLRHIYSKPKLKIYYDVAWIEYVKAVRKELGEKFRRLYYIKYPIIVFLDDKYIGDHRALIQHVTYEHGIIPDLPYPDLFPDFTNFLRKQNKKSYVYLDVRVGDLEDYVIGKMVFELHMDILPETCSFFSYLCEPFGHHRFSSKKREFKFTYMGSSVRRICAGSFLQGGAIPGAEQLRVRDESFTLKHDRRGVLSLANQGGNVSTTEFVISLKENTWMDGTNVAFGQLIFGESLLEAIEQVPTYYQSPLKDILIVGCGVIPDQRLRQFVDYELKLTKMKVRNISNVIETKKRNIQEIRKFEKKIYNLLKQNEEERKCEFMFTNFSTSSLQESSSVDQWVEEGEEFQVENIKEEDDVKRFEHESYGLEYNFEDEIFKEPQIKVEAPIDSKELTFAEILTKAKKKDKKLKTDMITEFIHSILQKVFNVVKPGDDSIQFNDFDIPEIEDVKDIRDVPSGMLEEDIFMKGLYSLPKSLRKSLLEAYNNLSPSKLKLLGLEARSVLLEGGVPQETLNVYSAEDFISGIVMAVMRVHSVEGEVCLSASGSESVATIVTEICQDTIRALKARGPDFVRQTLSRGGESYDQYEHIELDERNIEENIDEILERELHVDEGEEIKSEEENIDEENIHEDKEIGKVDEDNIQEDFVMEEISAEGEDNQKEDT